MAIELSPIIAQDIETAARHSGFQGILSFYAEPNTWSPMYLREEAQFLASVINAGPKNERVLWGFDRQTRAQSAAAREAIFHSLEGGVDELLGAEREKSRTALPLYARSGNRVGRACRVAKSRPRERHDPAHARGITCHQRCRADRHRVGFVGAPRAMDAE